MTQTASTTVLSFNLTGTSGNVGFSNMTIAKNNIPFGSTPIVYIDGVSAADQGYTQDSQNYYVWFTTHFSTHQINVAFAGQTNPTSTPAPNQPLSTAMLIGVSVAVIAAVFIIAVAVLISKNRLQNPFFHSK